MARDAVVAPMLTVQMYEHDVRAAIFWTKARMVAREARGGSHRPGWRALFSTRSMLSVLSARL